MSTQCSCVNVSYGLILYSPFGKEGRNERARGMFGVWLCCWLHQRTTAAASSCPPRLEQQQQQQQLSFFFRFGLICRHAPTTAATTTPPPPGQPPQSQTYIQGDQSVLVPALVPAVPRHFVFLLLLIVIIISSSGRWGKSSSPTAHHGEPLDSALVGLCGLPARRRHHASPGEHAAGRGGRHSGR